MIQSNWDEPFTLLSRINGFQLAKGPSLVNGQVYSPLYSTYSRTCWVIIITCIIKSRKRLLHTSLSLLQGDILRVDIDTSVNRARRYLQSKSNHHSRLVPCEIWCSLSFFRAAEKMFYFTLVQAEQLQSIEARCWTNIFRLYKLASTWLLFGQVAIDDYTHCEYIVSNMILLQNITLRIFLTIIAIVSYFQILRNIFSDYTFRHIKLNSLFLNTISIVLTWYLEMHRRSFPRILNAAWFKIPIVYSIAL